LGGSLARVGFLLALGVGVLFSRGGGRSRSGRVERDAATYGPGRLLAAAPGTRVLCLYLRGERQAGMSDLPARGQRFRVAWTELEPSSEQEGLRRALDLTRQVLAALAALEDHALAR
jgi:hypothetical protein